MPLFAQIGRHDDEDAPFSFSPALGDNKACLNGFAQAHFVGQDDAPGKRAFKSKERRINLMGI